MAIILTVLAYAFVARAQVGWDANQVNTTMCYWEQLRGESLMTSLCALATQALTSSPAAVLRDTVYLDGGKIYWLPGLSDGGYGTPIPDSR